MDFVIFVVNFLFSLLYILLVLGTILPWIPGSRVNPVGKLVYQIVEPILRIVRMGLPPLRMGMDVSPFVILVLFWIIHQVILKILS